MAANHDRLHHGHVLFPQGRTELDWADDVNRPVGEALGYRQTGHASDNHGDCRLLKEFPSDRLTRVARVPCWRGAIAAGSTSLADALRRDDPNRASATVRGR